MTETTQQAVETARQAGYDSGYVDGVSVVIEQVSDRFLTVQEVAEQTGLTEMTVRVLSLSPYGPKSVRHAGQPTFWSADDLSSWIEEGNPRAALRSVSDWLFSLATDDDLGGGDPARSTGPVVCARWCEQADGHPHAAYREDQRCYGESVRVELSRHPPLAVYSGSKYTDAPDYLLVFAERTPDRDGEVHVQRGDGPELRLTTTEAMQYLKALALVVGQVRDLDA